jgi:hypothetical protein
MTEMPDDFWPDEVLVIGKYKGHELAFAMLSGPEAAKSDFPFDIDGLRRCLWNEIHINHKESV